MSFRYHSPDAVDIKIALVGTLSCLIVAGSFPILQRKVQNVHY